jgi:hypothetical protein
VRYKDDGLMHTRPSPATPRDTGRTAVAERVANQRHRLVQPALQRNQCCTANAERPGGTGVHRWRGATSPVRSRMERRALAVSRRTACDSTHEAAGLFTHDLALA